VHVYSVSGLANRLLSVTKQERDMQIEVSNGEILDKQTILCIKKEKITDESKLENIQKELSMLNDVINEIDYYIADYIKLLIVNRKLWEVEDEIRLCEKEDRFDDYFITLARQVYILNDERAAIKKQINLSTGSSLVEEKSYQ
jgi:hypothetical protein